MAYDNTNRGVLFINDRKEKDTHPDRTGSINVDGVEYFIDGWLKESNGKKFLSLSVKRKNKQSAPQRQTESQQPTQRQAPGKPRPPQGDPDAGVGRNSPDADPSF